MDAELQICLPQQWALLRAVYKITCSCLAPSLSDLVMTKSSCPVGVGLLNRKTGSKKKKTQISDFAPDTTDVK